jgi:hypothetical protein
LGRLPLEEKRLHLFQGSDEMPLGFALMKIASSHSLLPFHCVTIPHPRYLKGAEKLHRCVLLFLPMDPSHHFIGGFVWHHLGLWQQITCYEQDCGR